jgi:hypothetical protein
MLVSEEDAEEFLNTLMNAALSGADVRIMRDAETVLQLAPMDVQKPFSFESSLA